MTGKKPAVLVLYNEPRTAEHGAWLESDAGVLHEVTAVSAALAALGFQSRAASAARLCEVLGVLATAPEKIVFNLVEGFQAKPADMTFVPAFVSAAAKSCTGSDAACLTLTLDKWRTKGVLREAGLAVPDGFVVPPGARAPRPKFPGPYIVKPLSADASEGIDNASIVARAGKALDAAVKRVHESSAQSALVERFVEGREVNVSIIDRGDGPEVVAVAEIEFVDFADDQPRIVGYEAKWLEESFEYRNTERRLPARLAASVEKKMRRACIDAWRAVGCSDYARVDIRLDGAVPYILEINANPDISPEGGFAAALEHAGIYYEAFVGAMVANAVKRLQSAPASTAAAGCCKGQASAAKRVSAGGGAPARGGTADAGEPRIRRVAASDRGSVRHMLEDTEFFRPDEVEIAMEVFDDSVEAGPEGHYQSFVIEADGEPLGWVCYGPTPCTVATWDIYWIVVAPKAQSRGFGRRLMELAEKGIAEHGGQLSIIETSGKDLYAPTQKFYLKIGYAEAARIEDFYAPGDAKIIYVKRVG